MDRGNTEPGTEHPRKEVEFRLRAIHQRQKQNGRQQRGVRKHRRGKNGRKQEKGGIKIRAKIKTKEKRKKRKAGEKKNGICSDADSFYESRQKHSGEIRTRTVAFVSAVRLTSAVKR